MERQHAAGTPQPPGARLLLCIHCLCHPTAAFTALPSHCSIHLRVGLWLWQLQRLGSGAVRNALVQPRIRWFRWLLLTLLLLLLLVRSSSSTGAAVIVHATSSPPAAAAAAAASATCLLSRATG